MDTTLKTCYHEAGHAVIAWLHGSPYGCRLRPEGGGAAGEGELREKFEDSDYDRPALATQYKTVDMRSLLTDSIITCAGVCAAAIAGKENLRFVTVAGPDGTMTELAGQSAFEDWTFQTGEAWTRLAMARAEHELRTHWDAVKRVALALHEQHVLSSDEVGRLLHPNNKLQEAIHA